MILLARHGIGKQQADLHPVYASTRVPLLQLPQSK